MKCLFPLLVGVLFLTGCKQEALLTGLDQVQANEVVALLQKNNIQAKKNDIVKSGFSVSVAPNDFATAVDLMTIHNLPSRPRMEISALFPADAFVSSPRAEIARIYSGVEQRLEQTLNQMSGVVSSRVHVSYDMNNTETDKNKHPVHLSALLRVQDFPEHETHVIADVKRLLVNSFSNVEYDNISVVLTPAPITQQFNPVVSSTKFNSTLTPLLFVAIAIFTSLGLIAYSLRQRKMKISPSGVKKENETNPD